MIRSRFVCVWTNFTKNIDKEWKIPILPPLHPSTFTGIFPRILSTFLKEISWMNVFSRTPSNHQILVVS